MASRTVTQLTAVISANNTQFKKGINGAKTSMGALQSTIAKLGPMIVGAFSVAAIKNFAKASIQAYDTQLKAEQSLLTALDGRVIAQQKLMRQAQELQRITLFGDEETIAAQSMIAAFVSEEDQIRKLIPLIQDFATAKQMGLVQAADLVTKTFASSTNALSRYGITVEGTALSAGRLNDITNALEKSFGGQAEAAAQADQIFTQLKNTYGDFQESVAGFVSQKGRFGVFQVLQQDLENLSKWLDSKTDVVFKKAAKNAEEFMDSIAGKDKQQQIADIQERIKGLTNNLEGQRDRYKELGKLAEESGRKQQKFHEDQQESVKSVAEMLLINIDILQKELNALTKVEDKVVDIKKAVIELNKVLNIENNIEFEDWVFDFDQAEEDMKANADAHAAWVRSITKGNKDVVDTSKDMSDTLAVAFAQIGSSFAQSLGEVAAGTKTFEEALKDISSMILGALGDILILVGTSTSPMGIPLILAGLALKGIGAFIGASGGKGSSSRPEMIGSNKMQSSSQGSVLYGNDIRTSNDYYTNLYNKVG